MDLTKTGERIRERRKELGLKQDQLAEMLIGIPTTRGGQTISEYENGRNIPPLEKLQQLATILECDVEYLLGCQEHPNITTSWIAEQIPLNRSAIESLKCLNDEATVYGNIATMPTIDMLDAIIIEIEVSLRESLFDEEKGYFKELAELDHPIVYYLYNLYLAYEAKYAYESGCDESISYSQYRYEEMAVESYSNKIGIELSKIICKALIKRAKTQGTGFYELDLRPPIDDEEV